MAQGITRKQQRILSFIQEYIFEHNVSPSYSEIAAALEISSKSIVYRTIRALEERGAITTLPGRNRSIRLVGHHRHRQMVSVPAEPSQEEFEKAKDAAKRRSAMGEDLFWAFWQEMLDPYQSEP